MITTHTTAGKSASVTTKLLVYFVFTYFCGAVYDGRIYGKIQMAAASLFYIEQMLMARFVKNEDQLYEEDIRDIVYRYSREVEHSDANLEKLEKLMEFCQCSSVQSKWVIQSL